MISLENVYLTLGGQEILKDVSLSIAENETGVILGASGSGKTTILRVILGLFKPDSGRVSVNGEVITDIDEEGMYRVREKMGMVFQGGALFDSLTVGENVAYRLNERGELDPGAIEERATRSLCFVGLDNTLDMMPSELSGGMKKRVAIARGIVASPKIMLYDEPTAGLDPINAYNISSLIKRLKEEEGVTSVVVTHDIPCAFMVADKVAFIHEGRIRYMGDRQGLLESTDKSVRDFLQHAGNATDTDSGAGHGPAVKPQEVER